MLRFQPAHGDGLALLGKDSEPADEGQFLDSAQTVQYVVFEPDGGRLVPVEQVCRRSTQGRGQAL